MGQKRTLNIFFTLVIFFYLSEIVTTSAEMLNDDPTSASSYPPIDAEDAKNDWDLEACKIERISSATETYNKQLHPLSSASPKLCFLDDLDGETKYISLDYLYLRVAIRGEGVSYIYLSEDKTLDLNSSILYRIEIERSESRLRKYQYGDIEILKVGKGVDISQSKDTRFNIFFPNSSLDVYVGEASEPLLSIRDSSLSRVHYIGFDNFKTNRHAEFNTTFKYGCAQKFHGFTGEDN